jgi:hypothetical protein
LTRGCGQPHPTARTELHCSPESSCSHETTRRGKPDAKRSDAVRWRRVKRARVNHRDIAPVVVRLDRTIDGVNFRHPSGMRNEAPLTNSVRIRPHCQRLHAGVPARSVHDRTGDGVQPEPTFRGGPGRTPAWRDVPPRGDAGDARAVPPGKANRVACLWGSDEPPHKTVARSAPRGDVSCGSPARGYQNDAAVARARLL